MSESKTVFKMCTAGVTKYFDPRNKVTFCVSLLQSPTQHYCQQHGQYRTIHHGEHHLSIRGPEKHPSRSRNRLLQRSQRIYVREIWIQAANRQRNRHPQTNGLTKRFNQALVTKLIGQVNKQQNDWDTFLVSIKFDEPAFLHVGTSAWKALPDNIRAE